MTLRRWISTATTLVFCAATMFACADDDGHTGGNVCDDMATEYDAYSAGLTKIGDGSSLKVRIMDANPAPPHKGSNNWMFQLLDMNDQPLPNATITSVTPFMPEHGHGTQVQADIGATDSNGEVAVGDIDFMMPGVWTVTVDVDNAGSPDAATFAFCIDG